MDSRSGHALRKPVLISDLQLSFLTYISNCPSHPQSCNRSNCKGLVFHSAPPSLETPSNVMADPSFLSFLWTLSTNTHPSAYTGQGLRNTPYQQNHNHHTFPRPKEGNKNLLPIRITIFLGGDFNIQKEHANFLLL